VGSTQVSANDGKGILFLDELTSAPQMTQAGCYQLVLDRKLGEYVLPMGGSSLPLATRIGAWRALCDAAASAQPVCPSRTRSRPDRLVQVGRGRGVRPEIIAFLRFKPDLLHAADTTSDANAWPTPRSWEMVHMFFAAWRAGRTQLSNRRWRVRGANARRDRGAGRICGTAGLSAPLRQLPSIDEILLNPSRAAATEPSAQIAISTALGR